MGEENDSTSLAMSLDQVMKDSLSSIPTRSEMEKVITDLLQDIHQTVRLQEQLHHYHTQKALQQRIEEYENALDESSVMYEESQTESRKMATNLLRELWETSRKLGEWHQLQGKHEDLLEQHDQVLARLYQAEEDLNELRTHGVRVGDTSEQMHPTVTTTDGKSEEVQEDVEQSEKTAQNVNKEKESTNETPSAVEEEKMQQDEIRDPPAVNRATSDATGDHFIPESTEENTEGNTEIEDNDKTKNSLPEASTPPVVALEEDNDQDKPIQFAELDSKILMVAFSYLDALDILNTAQTCVSLYSRVDSLFGLGGQPEEDNSTIATTEVAQTQTTIAPIPSNTPAPAAATQSTDKTGDTATSQTQSTVPTVATIASSSTPVVSATVIPASTLSLGRQESSAMPKRGILSGLFEQANQAAVRSLANAKASPSRKPAGHQRSSSQDSGAAPMNASMANSMAAKLTDAELNAIILMTERLKQKEAQADKLKREKEELAAKLDGVEGVKEFLIAKVRDMELSITQTVESETKVALQIASDQEVISFLDGRVQELEREKECLEAEKGEAKAELEAAHKQNTQKASVLGDMIQFEREKLAESEREFRAKKKVLVREIKTIRGQLALLQGERDGLEREVESYRKRGIVARHERSLTPAET